MVFRLQADHDITQLGQLTQTLICTPNMSHVMRKPVYAICQHLRSLISTFVVRCLDSIIPLVSIFQISSLYLASVAMQAGLSL